MPLSQWAAIRLTTVACGCHCGSHRRRGDMRFATPRCQTRLPASRSGDACAPCNTSHLDCLAGGCGHMPTDFKLP